MGGRRPKPLAIHQLNGNPRHFSKAELNGADNPQPDLIEPEMPKGMPKAARREWRRIVPLLKEINVLSKVDGLALAAYCRAHSLVEQAAKEIETGGLTFRVMYEDEDSGKMVPGEIKANPAVGIYMNAMKVMKSFLIEFGLTPASRSKLKVSKSSEADPMANYLNRKPGTPPIPFAAPEPVDPSEMSADSDEEKDKES